MEKAKIKILLIEDDKFLATVYQLKLTEKDFEVVVASDGLSGLQKIKTEKPNLVLLDIIMPKLDGFEVLKTAKKDLETKNIPIIMLSNLGQQKDIDKAFELGASDYCVKDSYFLNNVEEKINKILPHG